MLGFNILRHEQISAHGAYGSELGWNLVNAAVIHLATCNLTRLGLNPHAGLAVFFSKPILFALALCSLPASVGTVFCFAVAVSELRFALVA